MRLSKIRLAGFKSFVDPTTMPLPTNLTGVIGPNGCGKSNIIDAVRWVMGESSAKNLRGDSMADVIFNGSTSRKPVGQASIELIFDNSDGSLGGEYAKYSEIAIKRNVGRDGQSVYYLNNTRCRRRDITDIFLGTGLGPRSYAIIEQGTISRLIEAKPEELRVFLEEAAGISKYKERRRETENRIRHTRDNLDRLNDLREELEKQLNHLKRQARTAERYKELKKEERLLKGQLQALRWRLLDGDAHKREEVIREKETALEASIARQRAAEAGIEQQREAHVDATENFNTVQSEFYRIGADIARLEQTIQHARERYQQQQRDMEQVEQSWSGAQAHQQSDLRKIDELKVSLAEREPQANEAQEVANRSSSLLAEAEQGMQEWQSQWDSFNQRAQEPSQTAQVERARIQHHEQQVNQLQKRLARIDEEQNNLSIDRLQQEITDLRTRVEEWDGRSGVLQERLDHCLGTISTQREENQQQVQKLDQIRTTLQRQRGRHASLEALQQGALGKRKGAVTDWLTQQGLGEAKRLAQDVEVEQGWEHAVECVLGFNLEAVCVDGMDPVLGTLGSLQHGALALFDTRAGSGTGAVEGNTLQSKVKSGLNLESLLNGVMTAETLEQAVAMRGNLASHESVITRDGVWLGKSWLRVARDADDKAGVLHREQELKELAEEIATLEKEAESLHAASEAGRTRLAELERDRETLQSELNDVNRQRGEHNSQLSGKQARLEQINKRRERLEGEAQEVKQHVTEAEQEIEGANASLRDALAQMETLAMEREELTRRREEVRGGLDQIREQARADGEAAHALSIQLQTMRTELETTEQALLRMDTQLAELSQRRDELKQALVDGDKPIREKNEELETLLEKRMAVETRLSEARKSVENIDHALRELEGERTKAEREAESVRSSLEGIRMSWQELKVRRQTLQEQVTEAGFEIRTLLEEMSDDARIEEWEELVEKMHNRIQRLGPINLAAIDEFEQQSERKEYLDSQHKDLTEALETLEGAIRKIDRETRTRFKETYDRVNKGLQEKFPRLFGGGHAYLELTGDDLLDTGVTVMARPPGKRNSTIHLLSGGEKALTAVALVFAIFELNPSPFCMLDEVDAPLDDANVARYCDLVAEMAERVQFIFITHNKVTMELAEQLAGVTMHEPGVSRLVSVDVDEAVQLAAV